VELLRIPVLLIANPAARRAPSLLAAAERAFRAADVRCDVVLTERPGHGAEVASRLAGGYGAVFTLGGDGTAMEVVGALAHSGVPVGVLPGGTGNLVARSLRIPLRVETAVVRLLAGDIAAVDLGVLDSGRRFAFSAGVGVDARMIAETSPRAKQRFGVAGYAYTAARVTLRRRSFLVRAEVDGEQVERTAAAVMLANFGTVLSNLMVLGPGIRSDDGVLDLCVFSPVRSGDAIRVAWRLLRKDFRSDAALLYRSGRHFRIECDPPQVFQADGEVLGTTPFSARVDPLAARLLVPAAHD
jgi:diacylglycerol kinase (ATP)